MSSALLVRPAFQHSPAYTATDGGVVAGLCELAGFAPDEEQRLGLDMIFAVDERGMSAAFEFGVVCSRQNMKTGLFKMAALGWLFVTEQRLIVWSAHEFRTAQEAFRDMSVLVHSTPWMSRQVAHIYTARGNESIELKTGQRLIFKARTTTGGRGLTGDKIVLDEAFALQPDHMGALLPTLSVRPDPQLVYGSSAGMPQSDILRGVRDRGRSGTSPRLAYLEWGAPTGGCVDDRCSHMVGVDGCALDDVVNWHAANPLLGRTRSNGTGLTLEYIQAERQALPPAEFARERLGWWDEPDGAAAAFGGGKWEACATDEERPADLPIGALAVAVSFDLTKAAIGAAARSDEHVWLKPMHHAPGTSWVVASAKALQDEHGVDVVVDGRGPAAVLIPDLEAAGVRLVVAGTSDVLDACAGLFDQVQDRRVRHGGFPELDAAVGSAVKRPVGDRWAWGRKASTADISVLESVTLADWAASNRPNYDVADSVW